MFCTKCGTQIPDDAKFCEKCGTPTDGSEAPAATTPAATTPATAVPAAAAAAPKAPGALSSFFSNKRNVMILAAAVVLVVVIAVVAIVIATSPKTIVLDDYFDITYTGCDGYAKAKIEWDTEKLEKLNEKVFRDNKNKKTDNNSFWDNLQDAADKYASLRDYVTIKVTYDEQYLSNGDTLTVSYTTLTEDFEERYHVKLKLRHEKVKVEGLKEPFAFDPTAGVSFSFEGYNGYGNLVVKVPSEPVAIGESGFTMGYSERGDGFNAYLITSEGYNYYNIYYRFDRSGELKNGDKIVCSISADENINRELAASAGITVSTEPKTVTVSGLSELVSVDPFEQLTATFAGYDSLGEMQLSVGTAMIPAGNYQLRLSVEETSSRRRLVVEICNKDGQTMESFNYSASEFSRLSNGATVEFSTSENLEYLQRNYGLTFAEKKSLTVSGLETPTTLNLRDRLSLSFGGFEGYGAVTSMTVKEDVFTAGAYTFKLTPSLNTEGWSKSCTLTVVVADNSGNNLFTVEYRAENFYNIASNGATVTFSCRANDRTREEYLRDYGIAFDKTFEYTVSGLSKTIAVDPREMLNYSFSGENGQIELTLSLKQTSYTAGDYTINLEIRRETSWWSEYLREYFTVTDKEGNTVASGYYQASDWKGLSEGATIRMNEYVDKDAIASAIGLVFSEDRVETIVSTK